MASSGKFEALAQQAKTLRENLKSELQSKGNARVGDLHQVPNPFVYKGPLWTKREKKLVWLGVVLVPLRLLLLACLILPVHLLLWLSVSKVQQDEFDPKRPMRGWRRQIQLPAAQIFRVLIVLLGLRVETVGSPCTVEEAKIVVCAPHSTFYDSLFLAYAYRVPSAISKAENLTLPLFGVMFRAIQAITVDRADKGNRSAAMDALRKRSLDPEETRHLLIFPEGTCTNREVLITFKRGAFTSGQPVQPVALEWPNNEFDMTWTAGGPSRFFLVLHLLCQPRINLKVHFLPVYRPNLEEQANADLFANNVRQVIATTLGVGVTNHSTEDMFLAKEARRLKLNLGETLPFEFQELSSLFNITAKDAKALLHRYSKVYSATHTKITGEEFANVLGIPFTSAVSELFDLLREDDDGGNDGAVDFKHLLVRICQISNALNSMEDLDACIELVWEAVGGGSDGELPVAELNKSLAMLFPHTAPFKHTKPGDRMDFNKFKLTLKAHPEMLFVAMGSLVTTSEAPTVATMMMATTGEEPVRRRLSVLIKPE
ncbi:hypothetical protein BASA81_001148 [Batrachochytrium salamandrivorans]|nr:hypothetical protein BASA81_001148 [Batrachochytrium salamandrivorans]